LTDPDNEQENYGECETLPCDLSLVSGPFIWESEYRAAVQSLPVSSINAYPFPNENLELLELLASREDVDVDWIFLTAGADVGLEILLRQTLRRGDELAVHCPNFPRFFSYAATLDDVHASAHMQLDMIPPGARMISICTPNNPSTKEIHEQDLRRVIEARPDTIFCIDGVFDWYGSYRLSNFCREFQNVFLLKSFSKIGLAGLRLGYIVSHPENLKYLTRGLTPFLVPALIQSIGLGVARNFDRISEIVDRLDTSWDFVRKELGSSATRECPVPFYLVQTTRSSDEAARLLAMEGISIVSGRHFEGLAPGTIRVALGDMDRNRRFVEAIDRLGLIF
jgi:histidinol-phosphate/aromatic aminotransferase/cobyric acid decarboxylase-like protein